MTADEMEHDHLRECSGLYALGALAPSEQAEFERHLATCPTCAEEVRSLEGAASALPYGVPLVDPPASLRTRVLSTTGDTSRRASVVPIAPRAPSATARRRSFIGAAWLSAAALLVMSVGLGVYAWSLRQQIGGLEERLRDATSRLDRSEQQVEVATRAVATTERRVAVLLAPDMLQVNLEGQPAAPRASGRAFWSRSRGLVFTAAELPPLPAGRIYQLWLVSASAALSAGLLSPDASGRIAQAFDTPIDVPVPVAVAVTIEPEGGLPAPSGAKYLVGLTH